MVEKKPVNIILQMIFAVTPILDIYASYKIQKLRWWLLIFWVTGAAVGIIYNETIYRGVLFVEFLNSHGNAYAVEYLIFVIPFAILQAMVMRTWSKKWNKSFRDKNKNFQ